MEKRMARKGETSPMAIILTIVVLGVTAVIVIIGFTQGWDVIFGKIGLLPGNLEAAAQSCGISATQDLKTSYCYEFKEVKIGGTKQFMTCDELEKHADFEALEGDCDGTIVTSSAKELCETLKDDKKVNGVVCWEDGLGEGEVAGVTEWGISKSNSA